MSTSHYDLLVLGGGNAVTVGIRAAKAGRSVAVIEKDRLGGTCPNRGCVPSKLLLGYAEVAAQIRESGRFHLKASIDAIDGDAILRETKAATFDVVDGKIEGALPETLTLYRGEGRFVAPKTVEVNGERVSGDIVIVATGTRPRKPPPLAEGLPYWTSDDVFEQEVMPASITVVGGGYIACELAYFFASVGVETRMLHRSDVLLRAEDRDIRKVFREGFCERVKVSFGTKIEQLDYDSRGFTMVLVGPEGQLGTHRSERLLFAIGRDSSGPDLGLESAGIAQDERGFVVADSRLRTSAEGVYVLGDLKGKHFFTHAAAYEATYLGDQILDGLDADLDYGPMPHAVFSRPEVAGVGATEDEIEAAGTPYVSAQLPYSTAAKGRAVKEQHGLCKILLDMEGKILGCHIVGHEAAVLIHEVIPVMAWRNHISSLTGIIHIHPSLSEVVRNVARKAEAELRARS